MAVAGVAAAVALVVPWMPVGAQAQVAAAGEAVPVRPIEPGQPITSRLDPEQGQPFADYRLHLEENQSVQIDMVSPAAASEADAAGGFDTYLELRTAAGVSVASNDDRGDGSLNSRLIFVAPSAGDYIVRASPLGGSIDDEHDSTYRLAVRILPPAPLPVALSSNRVEGGLGEGSPVTDFFGTTYYYAVYSFDGEVGERIQAELVADAEQPVVQLIADNGSTLAAAVGDNLSATAVTVLPATGRYLIRVQVPSGHPVHYTLTLNRLMVRSRERTQPIQVGSVVEDALTLRSNISPRPDGSGQAEFFYKLFSLRVRKERPVTVTLEATGFEPVLEAGEVTTLGFVGSMLARSGPTQRARLVVQPYRSGTIYIRVRSSGLALGSWRLQIVPGIAPAD